MTSFAKILYFTIIFFLPFIANGKETICYKLIETNDPSVKIGSIQFISFIGDQCYESGKNGISVKNGTMNKNDYQSTRNNIIYTGSSFCGNGSKFGFNQDKTVLTVSSKNGKRFVFKKTVAPQNVNTCSLIRKHNVNTDYIGNPDYNNRYNPSYVNQNNQSNYNNHNSNSNSNNSVQTKRRCVYCNGTGQITKNDNAPANFGIEKPRRKCSTCGEWYNPNVFVHYHQRCSHCSGTGYAK